jgi:hypothetical protein
MHSAYEAATSPLRGLFGTHEDAPAYHTRYHDNPRAYPERYGFQVSVAYRMSSNQG